MAQPPPQSGDALPSGRPRDAATGPALCAAARQLVTRHGYGAVSISMILAEAGVSRQSLYRRWPTKAALVLDAFLEAAGDPPAGESLDPLDAIEAFLVAVFEHLSREGEAIRSLIASAQQDADFGVSFRARFVDPRAAILDRLLDRAIEAGAIAAGDRDALSAMLHGAFWYRLLNAQPLDAPFARALVAVLRRSGNPR